MKEMLVWEWGTEIRKGSILKAREAVNGKFSSQLPLQEAGDWANRVNLGASRALTPQNYSTKRMQGWGFSKSVQEIPLPAGRSWPVCTERKIQLVGEMVASAFQRWNAFASLYVS